MKRRKALFVGIVVAAGVAVASSEATTPGSNGLIAYQQEVHGRFQLFTIRPNGTRQTQITRVEGEATTPSWSPDGKLIVFTHETPPANGSVALISPRGTGFHELSPTGGKPKPKGNVWNGDAVFTPDGKEIVFVRNQGPADSGIWVMAADGSGLRRLTRNPFVRSWDGGDVNPSVSPDDKLVSFVRIKKDEKLQALFTVRTDGTALKQLTPYTLDVGIKQDWSPNGKLIVLITNADFARRSESANVATIRPDGTHLTALTRFTGRKQNAYAGSFSPDGKQIVIRLEQGDRYALAVIDRDGQNLRLVTRLGKPKPMFIAWGSQPSAP